MVSIAVQSDQFHITYYGEIHKSGKKQWTNTCWAVKTVKALYSVFLVEHLIGQFYQISADNTWQFGLMVFLQELLGFLSSQNPNFWHHDLQKSRSSLTYMDTGSLPLLAGVSWNS